MNTIGYDMGIRNVTDLATSALPDAPVVPDPAPRDSRLRITVAAVLRAATRRPGRPAERVDPSTRRPIRYAA